MLNVSRFLYIDPLKQGLKLKQSATDEIEIMFLYIDPLKQGLKRRKKPRSSKSKIQFLYIDPLKQGLKPCWLTPQNEIKIGFYT